MSQLVQAALSQRFAVSAECIFDAWLEPARISHWIAGTDAREERIIRVAVEPRVGGKFSFVINRQGVEIDHVGHYLELDRPDLLVFTWGTRDSLPTTSRVIVEILPLDRGCELTLTHVMGADWATLVDKTAGSWGRVLGALAAAFTETETLTLNPS